MLAQARATLEELKDANQFNNTETRARLPYILENFEVVVGSFHHSWSFFTQITGGLNSLLSAKWKLPNYIYIMFSNEQIKESEELGDLVYNVITNLFTKINRALLERKNILPKKARRSKPPQICIIRTVPRSDKKQEEKNFKNKRRTLNRAIQKMAAEFQWRTINVDTILPKTRSHFDEKGENLSKEGYRIFWDFISEDLRELEEENKRLQPKRQFYNYNRYY